MEELTFLGIDDDETFIKAVRFRGYAIVKDYYDKNIERLRSGKEGPAPLNFLSEEEILEEIKERYSDLEKKVTGGD